MTRGLKNEATSKLSVFASTGKLGDSIVVLSLRTVVWTQAICFAEGLLLGEMPVGTFL